MNGFGAARECVEVESDLLDTRSANALKGGLQMAAKKGEVYKCDVCGNVAAILEGGDGDLVCCGEDMQLVGESEAANFWSGLPKPGVVV